MRPRPLPRKNQDALVDFANSRWLPVLFAILAGCAVGYGFTRMRRDVPAFRGDLHLPHQVIDAKLPSRLIHPPPPTKMLQSPPPPAFAERAPVVVRSPMQPPPPPPPPASRPLPTCDPAFSAAHGAHLSANRELFASEPSHNVFLTWGAVAASGGVPQPLLIADVGANTGQAAERFLAAFPRALVHSFEPAPNTYVQLARARAASPVDKRARWALHELAVAAALGTANFSAPDGVNPQTFSLGQREDLRLQHTHVVNVTTVDALVAPGGPLGAAFVDLLKIDVEGWECDVLAGAAETLVAAPPRVGGIFFEYGTAWSDGRGGPRTLPLVALEARLRAAGFECFFAGEADLVRVAHAAAGLDIVGYGPNVLCLHRGVPASRAIVAAHSASLTPCLW